MAEYIRIKLVSTNLEDLNKVCNEIIELAKRLGVYYKGPIPLPRKILRVTVLKTPCGDGTGHGNATYDKFEMRFHKRIIEVHADERIARQLLRIVFPDTVERSIEIIRSD
ncbi:MAG: 30S ribosomal protein S10 [Candidatus Aenigmarchaeota archaeon]|nr:30S ribosomal protein S10 [Candidatus Aenigmarchaeota archaeon]MDW8149012.1 30S ribosomal protein S10 [Candidatus Aenigmarchaeota archaeon]